MALAVHVHARAAARPRPEVAVRVRVDGGRDPIRLAVYLAGDLVADHRDVSRTCEVRVPCAGRDRLPLTVRALDAAGQWGGRSVVFQPHGGPRHGPPCPPALGPLRQSRRGPRPPAEGALVHSGAGRGGGAGTLVDRR
jgi:hypothetical protein